MKTEMLIFNKIRRIDSGKLFHHVNESVYPSPNPSLKTLIKVLHVESSSSSFFIFVNVQLPFEFPNLSAIIHMEGTTWSRNENILSTAFVMGIRSGRKIVGWPRTERKISKRKVRLGSREGIHKSSKVIMV
jgi:hypothetical protein